MSALWWGLTALKFQSPEFDPKYEKKNYILGLSWKISCQIASLFDMYIDMDERITGKQDRPSLIIEDPPRAHQISQNIYIFLHSGPHIQIVSLCCTYVSTVMRSAFGAPGAPGFYVRAQHYPKKCILFIFGFICYFNWKGSYQIASIFNIYVIIKEKVDVSQDGPSLNLNLLCGQEVWSEPSTGARMVPENGQTTKTKKIFYMLFWLESLSILLQIYTFLFSKRGVCFYWVARFYWDIYGIFWAWS